MKVQLFQPPEGDQRRRHERVGPAYPGASTNVGYAHELVFRDKNSDVLAKVELTRSELYELLDHLAFLELRLTKD